ncbi:hypothetical protein B0H19DRAFT_1264913 [Mycena capillaripes]|nr:hypothetical protein B0H19DRAFT_1264913 [Mycena capillaripes]
MSEKVTIIIDDTALLDQPPEDINFGDTGAWYVTTSDSLDGGFPSNYNNTNFIPDFTPVGDGAWVFGFDGTSVSLFGITPPSQFPQTIAIDNTADPFYNLNITNPHNYTVFNYPAAARGGLFYTSDRLFTPGEIKVGITGARGLAIDYAVVTVRETTDLSGQTILVDDSSSEITWNGQWSSKDNYTMPVPCTLPLSPKSEDLLGFVAAMSPHGNTSHASSTPGDSFTFQFAGTSLVVSGVTPGEHNGQGWFLHMQFTLDGKVTNASFTSDPAYVTKPHFTYFTSGAVKSGNHTLVGKVLAAIGTPPPAAQIDYITYKPSFLTVQDKPIFGSAIANATQDPVGGGNPSPSSSSTPPSQSAARSSRGTPVGSIIGGVVGGLVLLACIFATLLIARRKRRRTPKPELVTEPFTSQAFTSRPSTSETSMLKGSRTHSQPSSPVSPENAPNFSQAASLTRQRLTLAAEIHSLETQTNGGSETLENRVRELQSQMTVLTQEIQAHLSPPSYAG